MALRDFSTAWLHRVSPGQDNPSVPIQQNFKPLGMPCLIFWNRRSLHQWLVLENTNTPAKTQVKCWIKASERNPPALAVLGGLGCWMIELRQRELLVLKYHTWSELETVPRAELNPDTLLSQNKQKLTIILLASMWINVASPDWLSTSENFYCLKRLKSNQAITCRRGALCVSVWAGGGTDSKSPCAPNHLHWKIPTPEKQEQLNISSSFTRTDPGAFTLVQK